MKKQYDYLIVGAGLYGCVCAERLSSKGYSVLVVEKENYVGGTCYTKNEMDINVHVFGAHIFRTNDDEVFNYISKFTKFNNFINSPIAIHKGKAYNLPFNMNTFCKIWDITKPSEAKTIIENEIKESAIVEPSNLEEQAISLVGKTIYEMFIKEYTEKQWGKDCKLLPKEIIRRIPIRFTFDNNYYNAKYQGIPVGGYTRIFLKMLSNVDIILNCDFNKNRSSYMKKAKKIIYTGPIDEFFDYKLGELEYRGLKFVEKTFDTDNYQGNAVLNYNDKIIPYTRTIEHKHFEFGTQSKTIVSYEYPCEWKKGDYPFYPVNDDKNEKLYNEYLKLANDYKNIYFGGRLGLYKYFDMQDTIRSALDLVKSIDGE